MNKGFESFVAVRYLRSRRKEVFISIISIISVVSVALSVAVLDVVLAIMTGFEIQLMDKLVSANAHIFVKSGKGNITNWDELEKEVEKVPGVVSAFPYTYNQALLSTQAGSFGLLLRGVANVPEARAKIDKLLGVGTSSESLFKPAPVTVTRSDGITDTVSLPPIIIGEALRLKLGYYAGEPVTLFSPQFGATPYSFVPRMRRFSVVDIYRSGLMEYENGLAYIGMEDAQKFFDFGESVSGIEVEVKDVLRAPQIATNIADFLHSDAQGEKWSDIYTQDWTVPNKALWDALKLEKKVYFIVLLLLVLIASFSVVSTLVMMVMEKSRDIAILKAIGASNKSVAKIFFQQGTIIGFVGTVLGTLIGYAACNLLKGRIPIDPNIFSLDRVPFQIEHENFLLVAISAFIITSFAGIYPALRAAKLNPADALRFE